QDKAQDLPRAALVPLLEISELPGDFPGTVPHHILAVDDFRLFGRPEPIPQAGKGIAKGPAPADHCLKSMIPSLIRAAISPNAWASSGWSGPLSRARRTNARWQRNNRL